MLHSPHMQLPTCVRTRVRNVHDAQVILHAVLLGILPMVRRRLDDDERLALRPGHIYVWEERNHSPLESNSLESIQRFTDGRSWGPSKAREYVFPFLLLALLLLLTRDCVVTNFIVTSFCITRRKAQVEHPSFRGITA
jgi:hypothetical protein